MSKKQTSKLVALLLSLVMVIGMVPMTAFAAEGDTESNPVIVDSFAEFKAAMEDSDITYVQLNSTLDTLPKNRGHITSSAMFVGADKVLILNGNSSFTDIDAYEGFTSLISGHLYNDLTIKGHGILEFRVNVDSDAYNSVIRWSNGTLTIDDPGVTIHGGYNRRRSCAAIYVNSGTVNISAGRFEGSSTQLIDFGCNISSLAAIRIAGTLLESTPKLNITGGVFSYDMNDHSKNSLSIESKSNVTITEGTFEGGIGVLKGKTINDYLAPGSSWTKSDDSDTVYVGPTLVFEDDPGFDIPGGKAKIPYTSTKSFTATGGIPPYTFSITPEEYGMSINADNKLVYTRPAVDAEKTAIIKCTDSAGTVKTIQIVIGEVTPGILDGGIVYTSGSFYNTPISIAITGAAASVPEADRKYQWQWKSGSLSWTVISGATEGTYTPGADMIGKTVRVVVTAEGDEGLLVGGEKVIQKKSGYNETAEEPVLYAKTTAEFDSFILQNYKTTQEYVWRTSPETNTQNIDWTTNPITSGSDGSVVVSGSVNTTYYVYTRVKETATTQPGFFTQMSSVTLGDPQYLQHIVLDGYASCGAGNTIYIKIGESKKINIVKDPMGAFTWNNITFKSPVSTSLFSITSEASAPTGVMPGSITIKGGSTVGTGRLGTYYGGGASNYGEWRIEVYDPANVNLSNDGIVSKPNYDDVTMNVGDTYTPADQSAMVSLAPEEANSQYHLEWRVCTNYSYGSRIYNGQENELIKVDATTGEVTALKKTAGATTPQLASVALFAVKNGDSASVFLVAYDVEVLEDTIVLESISIIPTAVTLNPGAEYSFEVIKAPTNAEVTGTVSWSKLSGSDKITVDSTGKVAIATDATDGAMATIQASLGGKTATATVTVAVGEYAVQMVDGIAKVGGATITSAVAGIIVDLVADAAPTGKIFDKWVVETGTISEFDKTSVWTYFEMPEENVKIVATYKDTTKIDTIATMVTAPVKDATPEFANSTASGFYVANTEWEPTVSANFAAGTVYTVKVTVEAEYGYDFIATPTLTINGNTATKFSGSADQFVFTYQFPATQSTTEPTTKPTTEPTTKPSTEPTTKPSTEPTTKPSTEPTTKPSTEPTTKPSTEPTTKPSTEPTTKPVTEETTTELTFMLGDVNGDGKVNASDARLALRISAGLETATETQLLAADIDESKKVTASDARTILRVSAGLAKFEVK